MTKETREEVISTVIAQMQNKTEKGLVDVNPKTVGDAVTLKNGKTVETVVQEIMDSIQNLPKGVTLEQVQTEVSSKISEIVGAAPESLNTLEEIAAKLQEDSGALDNLLSTVANKVDKQEGKGLSTNDFTNELKTALDNLVKANIPSTLDSHVKNADIHVTKEEKTTWNGKSSIVLGTEEELANITLNLGDMALKVVPQE